MKNDQRILCFDTAMNGCGAGVWAGGRNISRFEPMASGQGERLMPLIGEVLAGAGLEFSGLGAVVTTLGPGAFTGLRIGLSAAKALSLALDIPVFGITTTQALALQHAAAGPGANWLGVVIETKRADFYFQSFSLDAAPLTEPQAMSAEQISAITSKESFVLIGDGVARYSAGAKTGEPASVDCGFLARHFAANPESGFYVRDLAPVYLRGAEVSQSKHPPRILAS